MGINDEVARAFGSHTLWKARILRAADVEKSEFKPDDVCQEQLCSFGRWLNDPKLQAEVKNSPNYAEVTKLHGEFHRVAGMAIRKAVSGEADGARSDVKSGSYFLIADKFFDSLFAWQRAAAAGLGVQGSTAFQRLLLLLTGDLAVRIWAGMLLPSILVIGSLWYVHHTKPAGADLILFDGIFGVGVLLIGLSAFALIRSVTRPLVKLNKAARDLIKGDHQVIIPAMERPDQLGELARIIQVFQQQALAVDRTNAVRENERDRNESERRIALLQMAENIERETSSTIGKITRDGNQLYETAKRMARGAQHVEENAQLVAAAAERSLVNAQTVATATEKLSGSIHEIAGQMEKSRTVVGEAVVAADEAATSVDSLGQAMTAIDQVVQVIAEIAGQTNLLALNATIEAARAGEAGKGFAVVANEVKTLANQTAKQTTEISERIGYLNEVAQRVIAAIHSTAGKVQNVEEIASAVAFSVQDQRRATDQISHNVGQSERAAREVSDRIVDVANEAVNTGQQAGEIEVALRRMTNQVGDLSHVLNRTVRTSTPEVNRRADPRYAVEATAIFTSSAGTCEARLQDISVSGARMVGVPRVAAGQTANLRIGDVDLPVLVIESNREICRVKIEESQRPIVERWIDSQANARKLTE